MTVCFFVTSIEADLKAARLSVGQFCAAASIDRATWQRWKAGKTLPRFDAWERVNAAWTCLKSGELRPEAADEAA